MLYGTDLTSAYADGFEAVPQTPTRAAPAPAPMPSALPAAAGSPSTADIMVQREVEQRKQQQRAVATLPPPMPSQQALPPLQPVPQPMYVMEAARPSYWDQLRATRREMSKLVVLALAVTLGLAVHHACKHYIKYFFATHDMTLPQETAVHVTYPLLLLFLLWNVKAVLSGAR